MKKIILTVCILSLGFAQAQTLEKHFDWNWKPCDVSLSRFYSVIKNTDSGWYRTNYYTANSKLQMKGLFKDSACKIKNGGFTFFSPDGKLTQAVRFVNDKAEGTALSFYYDGAMRDSGTYSNGKPVGTVLGWFKNGYPSDSSVYQSDGSSVRVTWFDDGTPSSAGKKLNGKKEGTWIYYHKNGRTAAIEKFQQDKLLSRIYYDEEGTALTDTTNKDHFAEFKGGMEKWKRYLERNLTFPPGYKLVNTDIITVVIAAIINEDGKVEDAFVEIPFKDVFDKEALRIIKNSPKWQPAFDHNRKVKGYVRQPVSFAYYTN